jgi:O-antigen/teichoic acid export membrane protein
LISAIGAAVFPHVASKQGREEQTRAFALATRLGVLGVLLLAVVVIIPTGWVVPLLFGDRFVAAVPAAMVMVVAYTIQGLNLLMEEGFRGMGHPATGMWAELFGLAVIGISLALLLGPLEILGAALASLFGYSAVTLFLVVQAQRITRHPATAFLCPTGQEIAVSWRRILTLVGEMRGK